MCGMRSSRKGGAVGEEFCYVVKKRSKRQGVRGARAKSSEWVRNKEQGALTRMGSVGCTEDAQEDRVGGPGGCFQVQALVRGLQVSRERQASGVSKEPSTLASDRSKR